jgi:hypothetical protein
MEIVDWIVFAFETYLGIGVIFATVFVLAGVNRIDPVARASSWGFRAMIFPGSVALWPLLLRRWILNRPPAEERNAHRSAALARRP